MIKNKLSQLVKQKRKNLKLTQPELAEKAGIGLRLLREIEQGKKSMRMYKVNLVLALFGFELVPGKIERGEQLEQEG